MVFAYYFLGSHATAYAKHPADKAWLFDADTMKPRINNSAWVRAIQDVIDALPTEPAGRLNADAKEKKAAWSAITRCRRANPAGRQDWR